MLVFYCCKEVRTYFFQKSLSQAMSLEHWCYLEFNGDSLNYTVIWEVSVYC